MKPTITALSLLTVCLTASAEFRPTWSRQALDDIESFSSEEKIVGTYYFYWYEYPDEHFFDNAAQTDDALQDHFPHPESVSYNSLPWNAGEVADIVEAGLDFILPVYWGTVDNYFAKGTWFSVKGLGPLQRAIENRLRDGKSAPKIGMFYDTSTLLSGIRQVVDAPPKPDLTTREGKDIFYRTIHDFFAQIKPEHWAAVDGRPIVVLYSSGFAAAHDQSTMDYVYEHFEGDFFGIRPYIIRETSWNVKTDSAYGWGAALGGPNFHGVACVGPGYNDSAVPGRSTPIRDREDGNFYAWGWDKVLKSDANIVLVETWNEMHEGTDICRSVEYGDQYIQLTKKFVDMFKEGETLETTPELEHPDPLPRPPSDEGKEYAGAESVQVSFEEGKQEQGVHLVRGVPDGPVHVALYKGRRSALSSADQTTYMYFSVVDPFYYDDKRPVEVEITYFDERFTNFIFQYDSWDRSAVLSGAYKDAKVVPGRETEEWRTVRFPLHDARFVNRQNGGSDFRLAVRNGPMAVSKIVITSPVSAVDMK